MTTTPPEPNDPNDTPTVGTVSEQNAHAHAVGPPSAGATVATVRLPLQPHDVGPALALGRMIRSRRLAAGLTIAQAADAAELSARHWRRLEAGERRTRSSTLDRIAHAIGADPVELAATAGPALADESPYAARIAARRARRTRKRRWALEARERDEARRQAAVEAMDLKAATAAREAATALLLAAERGAVDNRKVEAEIARLERELGLRP